MTRRVATVIFLIGFASSLTACTLQPDVAVAPPSGKGGVPPPALSGHALDGAPIAVEFRHPKTVPLFWASWCGPCPPQQPFLNRIATHHATPGVHTLSRP